MKIVSSEIFEQRKKIMDDIITEAGALIEKHTIDHNSLLLSATAMFTVVQRCYEIALGADGTAQFFRETATHLDEKAATSLDKSKFH